MRLIRTRVERLTHGRLAVTGLLPAAVVLLGLLVAACNGAGAGGAGY